MLYILILVIGAIASYFGPWWIVGPIALILCWWKAENAKQAFTVSAVAMISMWLGYTLLLNFNSEVNLMPRIADLFTGGNGILSKLPKTAFIMIIITLITGIFGGTSGMAGVHLREFFMKDKN